MKALIYKEIKLAFHPFCYVFLFIFPLMLLIPSYPLGVSSIYILTCYPLIFLGANKGQQSNDLLFSTLLPVRKKDIVLARILSILFLQITFIINMSILYPIAYMMYCNPVTSLMKDVQTPGLTLNSYVLLIGIEIIGFALADLIYFPIYYKNGKSIVMSTLLTIIGFVIYIGIFTMGIAYIPGLNINNLNIGIQFIILFVSILISFGIHVLVHKISSKRLELVDL